MNEARFTPSPWSVDKEDFEIFESEGGMICTVRHPQDSPCIDISDDNYARMAEECEANAHLIGAAPDLYAALAACEVYLGPSLRPAPEEVWANLYAALAKARGEQ